MLVKAQESTLSSDEEEVMKQVCAVAVEGEFVIEYRLWNVRLIPLNSAGSADTVCQMNESALARRLIFGRLVILSRRSVSQWRYTPRCKRKPKPS